MSPDVELAMTAQSEFERLVNCLNGNFTGELDWFELISVATEEFVATALYRSLIASDMATRVDPEALTFLAELERANRIRNRQLWELTCSAVTEINAAGIVPTLIKGAGEMALLADPSEYSRLLIDVDLVVPEPDVPITQTAIYRSGFITMEESTYRHSPGSYWRPGSVATIDLHHALPHSISVLLTSDDLRTRLIEYKRDGIRYFAPDSSLCLLINIAHDMLHHSALASGATSLRYLLSLIEQIENPTPKIDWDWLHGKRQNRRFRLAYDLQLTMLEHLFGMKLPVASPQNPLVQFLHQRRKLKFRNPRLGSIEWAIVRYILRASQFIGKRTRLLSPIKEHVR